MKSFYKLTNSLQNYAWGSIDGISRVTGKANHENVPIAELWMGTHPAAPSFIETMHSSSPLPLVSVITQVSAQGEPNNTAAQGLPFLFKILSAAKPLSLQVHPNRKQAIEGFARENALGIPVSDSRRNYRDANHKPEILAALTDFHAMCGFRPVQESVALLKNLEIDAINPLIDTLLDSGDYCRFLKDLLGGDQLTKNVVLHAIGTQQLATKKVPDIFLQAMKTAKRLLEAYPNDIGVLSPFYLNLIDLSPGEALYLPAGILHAYLEGTGFELMASSDNVLRGGLTPKNIDIQELVDVLESTPYRPEVIKPVYRNGLSYYPTPSSDFQLGYFQNHDGTLLFPRPEHAIVICTEGKTRLEDGTSDSIELAKGDSCYIAPSETPIRVTGHCKAWFATTPWETTDE